MSTINLELCMFIDFDTLTYVVRDFTTGYRNACDDRLTNVLNLTNNPLADCYGPLKGRNLYVIPLSDNITEETIKQLHPEFFI